MNINAIIQHAQEILGAQLMPSEQVTKAMEIRFQCQQPGTLKKGLLKPFSTRTFKFHHRGLNPYFLRGSGSILRQQQTNSTGHIAGGVTRRLLALLATRKLMASIACVTWQPSCDIALQWSCRKWPRNCPARRVS